ncbi:CHAT domain-containing protein [Sphaerospermopsis aphanizomenoides BCCUSP55]|uniref:CHAT domain-containing tetratricopeptide repeat protein n=1 Tax=Sphaerospermopsis aphanizomenoides TaxID=459663 RepID=UPI0019051315|nr:CHAT domain-containing protein [Sphaerospermopsis aphanizomenoides]MBK1990537.1 CHAT domain-containing protein [Sphaerospermopsis aphanizomenoides BCCUSP55]
MDKQVAVKFFRQFTNTNKHQPTSLGFILLVCLCLCSETVNAYSKSTRNSINPTHQLMVETDPRTQAQKLFDEGMKLSEQETSDSWREAIKKYQEALQLFKVAGDQAGEAKTLGNLGITYSQLGEEQEALNYLNQALNLSRLLNNRGNEIVSLIRIGFAYKKMGDFQQAISYYQQVIPLIRETKNKLQEAQVLSQIGSVYHSLGNKEQAVTYFNQGLLLFQEQKEFASAALNLQEIGLIYLEFGDPENAIKKFQQALPLWQKTGEPVRAASARQMMGIANSNLGNYQQAIDDWKQSFNLFKNNRNNLEAADILQLLGQLYRQLGDDKQSIEMYQDALALQEELNNKSGQAEIHSEIGLTYYSRDDYNQALSEYNKSLLLWRELGNKSEEARIINAIATVHYWSKNYQKAIDYLMEALPIFRAEGIKDREAETLGKLALYHSLLNEKPKAIEYVNQAIAITQTLKSSYYKALEFSRAGMIYFSLSDYQKALDYYNQALQLYRQTGNISSEASTLARIAQIEQNKGNLAEAEKSIKASIEIIEKLRTKVISPELRQTYFSSVQDYYQFCISLLMKLHEKDSSQGYDKQAFNYSERSRARTLLELLTEANANIKEGVDPQLLTQEKSLQRQIDAIEKQRIDINNNPNSNTQQKTTIAQEHKNLLNKYQELQNQIRSKSPKYGSLQYPQPLTLEQVQQQILDKDTILLQYSLGEERSYLWVVTKEDMTSYQLPSRGEIEKQAKNFNDQIRQINNQQEFTQAESLIRKTILTPVKDKITKKRILIVADRALQYVPFAALSLSENQQPLIAEHEIINLPSSSSLATIRNETKARKSAPKTLAVLADPVFSSDDQRVQQANKTISQNLSDLSLLALQRSLRSSEDNTLRSLPGTRKEAEAILNLVPETTQKTSAFDFDANLSTATNPQLSQYKIVHFATHGIFNTESPELSGVVLSLVNKNGKTVNGFLRLNEIFNLNLPADLVVISACETGLGQEIKGEGLVGLTRGFMYAASPRVLVSLWQVDDKATSEIMTRFYRLMLQKKLPPAEALREAQLEMQRETEWKSPYYWAAFVLQGEWR